MSFINLSDAENEEAARRIQRILTDATAEPWIILNSVKPGENITVGLVIGTGVGTVHYTVEDFESIKDGTAVPITWALGTITNDSVTGYFPSSVTGIKFVWTSGTVKGVISV